MAQEPQHSCFHPAPWFEGCTGTIYTPCGNRGLLDVHKLLHPLQWVAKMEKDSSFLKIFFAKWTTKAQRVTLLLHYWTDSPFFEPELKGMRFSPTIVSCLNIFPPPPKTWNSLPTRARIPWEQRWTFQAPSSQASSVPSPDSLSCHTSW